MVWAMPTTTARRTREQILAQNTYAAQRQRQQAGMTSMWNTVMANNPAQKLYDRIMAAGSGFVRYADSQNIGVDQGSNIYCKGNPWDPAAECYVVAEGQPLRTITEPGEFRQARLDYAGQVQQGVLNQQAANVQANLLREQQLLQNSAAAQEAQAIQSYQQAVPQNAVDEGWGPRAGSYLDLGLSGIGEEPDKYLLLAALVAVAAYLYFTRSGKRKGR